MYSNPGRKNPSLRSPSALLRVVVDGLTAANDLGLTDAVSARIGVLTDGRLRPITLVIGPR